jgi:hypothetical protein
MAVLVDSYPLFQNAVIYGLSADYLRLMGSSSSCDGMMECAKTSCRIFGLNNSVAHIVLDPINDGTKPSCNLYDHWYDRMQHDDQLQPLYYIFLSAFALTCLRMLFGFISLCRNPKRMFILARLLFVSEKLALVISLVLLVRLTKQMQFSCVAFLLLAMDTAIQFTPAKNSFHSQLLDKV